MHRYRNSIQVLLLIVIATLPVWGQHAFQLGEASLTRSGRASGMNMVNVGGAGNLPELVLQGNNNQRFRLVAGATLPDFSYTGFDGSHHQFSDLHAKYRLLDFWATWCLPCVNDISSKKAVYARYHAHGFEILGIDGEERRPNAAQNAIAEMGIPWPQAKFDPHLIYGQFGVYQLPTFVLVDSHNTIVAVATNSSGELAGDPLGPLLARLLAP